MGHPTDGHELADGTPWGGAKSKVKHQYNYTISRLFPSHPIAGKVQKSIRI